MTTKERQNGLFIPRPQEGFSQIGGSVSAEWGNPAD
jgi:hypothetical protein